MNAKPIIGMVFSTLLAVPALSEEIDFSKDSSVVIPEAIETQSGDWTFSIAPYLWAPGMEGQVGTGGLVTDIDLSTSDVFDNLDFGGFIGFGAEKGRWGFYLDAAFLKLGTDETFERGPLAKVDLGMEQVSIEAVVGYDVVRSDETRIQLFGGLTYTYLDVDLDLTNIMGGVTSRDDSEAWIDPVIGVRIRHYMTENWFINLVGEIGGFGTSSDLMWQAMAGLGYQVNDRWSVVGGYRHLYIDYEEDDFLYDTDTGGFMLGSIITF